MVPTRPLVTLWALPLALFVLFSSFSKASAQEAAGVDPIPQVRVMPDGTRLVLLARPGEYLSFLATYTAISVCQEGVGEEGLAAILAQEVLSGPAGMGGPGWKEERGWHLTRDLLLRASAKTRSTGTAFPSEKEDELHRLEDLIRTRTSPMAWTQLMEREGGMDLKGASSPLGFGLNLSLSSSRVSRVLALQVAAFNKPSLRTLVDRSIRYRLNRTRAIKASPRERAMAVLLSQAFKAHPFRKAKGLLPPPGPIYWSDAQAFWRREMGPAQRVFALVGPWPKALEDLSKRLFSKGVKHPVVRDRTFNEPFQEGARSQKALPHDPPRALMGWPIPKGTDKALLLVLADLIGDPREGRLTGIMKRKAPSLKDIRVIASYPSFAYPSLFVVDLEQASGFYSLEDLTRLAVWLVATWVPSEEEVRSARNRVRAMLLEERSSPQSLAAGLAKAEATGEGAKAWFQLPKRVLATKRSAVLDLLMNLFGEAQKNLVTTGASWKWKRGGNHDE